MLSRALGSFEDIEFNMGVEGKEEVAGAPKIDALSIKSGDVTSFNSFDCTAKETFRADDGVSKLEEVGEGRSILEDEATETPSP